MKTLDTLISDFNKQYKEEVVSVGLSEKHIEKIPFSSPRVNYMTYGGIPRGRLIEFAGEEGGGKTTTAIDIASNAKKLFEKEWREEVKKLKEIKKPKASDLSQLNYLEAKGPKKIVYADCENTLDTEWASLLGLDILNTVLLKPMSQSAEQIFEMILQMIETDEVGLVVIDSLGVMLSAQAYEKTMEEKTYGGIAMALTLFSRKAEMLCAKHNCTLIGINQMRDDMNSPYGGSVTTGGRAWKHNCSMRFTFQKGVFIDVNGNDLKRSAESPSGNLVMINIAKTKVCKPDRRTGFYTLNYFNGIDVIADTFDVAVRFGIIQQSGSWFNLIDIETGEFLKDQNNEEIKIQGKAAVIKHLKENVKLLNYITDLINKKIF